jgi:hypothetical protein
VTLLLGWPHRVYSLLSGLFVLVAGQALGGPQANVAVTASTLAIALAFWGGARAAQRTIDRPLSGKVKFHRRRSRGSAGRSPTW